MAEKHEENKDTQQGVEIVIGGSKEGNKLLQQIKEYLVEKKYRIAATFEKDDAELEAVCKQVCEAVQTDIKGRKGILVSGDGLDGMILCNKYQQIRASFCHDYYTAELTRMHNDANVLVLGQNITTFVKAKEMVDVFFNTGLVTERPDFQRRIDKITAIEKAL